MSILKHTAYVSTQDAQRHQANSAKVHIGSKFGFLSSHNGLRPGCIHTLMGISGGGKSTMIRSLVRDFAFHADNAQPHPKVMLVWLSEESGEDFRAELSRGVPDHERLFDIKVFSELEVDHSKTLLSELLMDFQPDVFLFDNITTSRFYQDKKTDEQSKFCWWIKKLSKDNKIATVLIAHTGAAVTESMSRPIEMNDIRGSKSIVNISEFFYILQRFQLKEDFYPTISISKNRGQDVVNRLYKLNYDKHFRSYVSDTAIDFEKFKEVFRERNRL